MNATAPGWYPDPTGRFAQRYHDGTNWTANVVDAAGNQANDPIQAQAGAPAQGGFATAPAASGGFEPTIATIATIVGGVLVLGSLLVFNWGKADGFDVQFSLGDINGGGGDIPFFVDIYASFLRFLGVLVAIAAVLIALKLVPPLNEFVANENNFRIAGIVVLVFAAWHAIAMLQTGTEEGVNTAFGSWLGLIGWAGVSVPWLRSVITQVPWDQKLGG